MKTIRVSERVHLALKTTAARCGMSINGVIEDIAGRQNGCDALEWLQGFYEQALLEEADNE